MWAQNFIFYNMFKCFLVANHLFNAIFPEQNSFAKHSVASEGQSDDTLIGSDNFVLRTPEPEIVIPSTLDHEQNNQFLSSSKISSFLSSNKSPSGTNTAHINDQKTQKPEENHQVEISSNHLSTRDDASNANEETFFTKLQTGRK